MYLSGKEVKAIRMINPFVQNDTLLMLRFEWNLEKTSQPAQTYGRNGKL
jgi:hypothetical protein